MCASFPDTSPQISEDPPPLLLQKQHLCRRVHCVILTNTLYSLCSVIPAPLTGFKAPLRGVAAHLGPLRGSRSDSTHPAPVQLTQQSGQLGDETGSDHLGAQTRVDGQVEQEAQGGPQQLWGSAGDQPGQLLHRRSFILREGRGELIIIIIIISKTAAEPAEPTDQVWPTEGGLLGVPPVSALISPSEPALISEVRLYSNQLHIKAQLYSSVYLERQKKTGMMGVTRSTLCLQFS